MTGITSSRPVFSLLGATVTALANIDTNQDGSVQFVEAANAIQIIVLKGIPAFSGLGNLRTELAGLDETEKAQLIDDLSDELDLVNDTIEEFVERAAKIVLDIVDLVIEINQANDDDKTGAVDAAVTE